MPQPVISFRDFSFRYRAQKKPTLNHINLDIYPGERILITGPSGCGKSTIGNCLNGLIPESYAGEIQGSLTVDGLDAAKAGIFELSHHIGTVLQDLDNQFIGLTVAEDIAFALENDCVPQSQMKEITRNTAQLVDTQDLLDSSPYELSGGQRQRVSLAGVLVNHVKILLFDEPLANLDPATGRKTMERIDEIQRKNNTTVIIIEHRIEDVLWCHMDRIILLQDGEVISDANPEEILCSGILSKNGIREPLYVTALRYASVPLTPEQHLAGIRELMLTENEKKAVRAWYYRQLSNEEKNESDVIMEIRDLSFRYTEEREVLTDISFKIHRGEMVSIVGRNGAGKSTLARLICGFETPLSGDILMGDQSILNDSIRQRASKIGYVMQNPNHMISKTAIFDEVALGIRKSGCSNNEIRERVENVLKICGLFPYRNWPINALSYGQKKRVTIASILVMGPEILILDEPTAGQDLRHYTEIMEFLEELNRKGITIILITHDMHLMLQYTPRTLVMNCGRLIADRPASQVLCDFKLTQEAALKETSLFALAQMCEIKEPIGFVDTFINHEREVKLHVSPESFELHSTQERDS